MVMSGGQIAGILDTKEVSQEDIMQLGAKFAYGKNRGREPLYE